MSRSIPLFTPNCASGLSSFLSQVSHSLAQAQDSKSAQYGFDFQAGCPLPSNEKSRYQWEEIPSSEHSQQPSGRNRCSKEAGVLTSAGAEMDWAKNGEAWMASN